MKMNVTLSTVLLTVLLSVATVTKSNSQPLTEIAITGLKTVAVENSAALTDLQTAYPRVYKKLLADYRSVNSLNYTVNGKTLYLNFTNNGQAVSSVYSVKGKMKYAITSIGKTLPAAVLENLKKEYPGYSLYYSRHVKTDGAVLYHIIMENCHEYLVLNYAGEEITEIKTMKK
jgi:hypothetical protein